MSTTVAPQAPGQLGQPVDPQQFLRYLQAFGDWVRARRGELDSLDQVARQRDNNAVTADLTLSMALWQACQDRYELLVATWDSGRVGPTELEKLTTLIWGRMDATGAAGTPGAPAGTALSLPEACRLSDALVGQLRTRLQLDPNADQVMARISAVRATVERLRDQAALEPAAQQAAARAKVDAFAQRAQDVYAKASRGGDVGGLLGPLELETGEYERDLIVGGVRRRQQRAAEDSTAERISGLKAQADALQKLVAQAVASVAPAPNYAVPDVDALGAPPADEAGLRSYNARLDQVSRAMGVVQTSYAQALADRDRLAQDAASLFQRIDAAGHADPELKQLRELTGRLLERKPTPVGVVAPLLQALHAATQTPGEPR